MTHLGGEGLTKAFNALAGWVPPVARMQKEGALIRSQGEAQARYNMLMADAAARSDAENPEVVARAAARFRASLLREQSNLDEVILSTCDELDENPPAQEHDHGPDDDWLALLVDVARKRSEREIQVLLGKILAGEIRHPRLFSPRTVQTLATLTPRIAHNFERLCNASVSTSEASFVLFGQLREMNEALALLEMYYVDLMHLDHFGLVVSSNFADLRLDFFINGQPIDLAGQQVRLIGQEDYIRFDKVAILLFSDSGAELRRLIAMKPNLVTWRG
jgi:hypothetical protein